MIGVNKLKTNGILKQIRKNKISYLMLSPYLILFVLFTLLPVLSAVVLSFTYYNFFESPTFIFLANYQKLFLADDVFLIAFKNLPAFSSDSFSLFTKSTSTLRSLYVPA